MALIVFAPILLAWTARSQDGPPQAPATGGHEPPPQAYEDCKGKKAGDTVQHTTPEGKVAATCMESPKGLVARPNQPPNTQPDNRPKESPTPRETSDRGNSAGYTIEQAISDRAQLSTIAFSGLAFVTGDFGAATFMPPGKVSDFFGFQYMRDIDAAGKGHNPIFLTRAAGDVLYILNDKQRQMFADLAAEQAPQFEKLALERMPLIEAFQREKDGRIPKGSSGLNREAVIRYVGDFYVLDAQLGYRRAEVFGQVVASLTPEQKAAFAKMKFGDFNTWPEKDESEALKRPNPGTSRFFPVAYMTYASEFFSWYAGSVEADTYFCPERHGTYFGSFYMKDMPAMNKRNYDISTAETGDSGEGFLKLLTAEQRENLTAIPGQQKKLLAEAVEVRRAISEELRKCLTGSKADKAKVLALGRRYGELDGEMSWMYATAFSTIGRTLTAGQRAACVKLRNLDGYQSAPAYMYSNPLQKLPSLPSSDFLFVAPPASSSTLTGASTPIVNATAAFTLRSAAVADGGQLPKEYTEDGERATLPLEWSGLPAATQSIAVIMHHIDPEGITALSENLVDPLILLGLQENGTQAAR
jgi:Spy/CpxP family protein refolding chaperone